MVTELIPGYSYDSNSQRYRNGSTGRFVSRRKVLELLDTQIQGAEKRMDDIAEKALRGEISPSQYADHIRTETRRLHLQDAALAKGGWDRLSQSDYGRAGAALKALYPRIAGTAEDIEEGSVSAAQVSNRQSAYAGSARRLYHNIERQGVKPTSTGKVVLEMRVLDPHAQHCEDCLRYAGQGVQRAGVLPVPGAECQCSDNCRCTLIRWEVDASEAEEAIGKQRESAMTDIQIEHDIIPLVERALRDDGTVPVKLIAPGWGTSGFYSPEVLRRDGPRLFVSGTQMFWDHPTMMEEGERPEGSLKNLAAVLVEDARYVDDGPDGPGLYAEAKAFGDYKPLLDELAPHIGVSIRASGKAAKGKADGKEGRIIEEITARKSADFVTIAGAGGKIIELFEAARDGSISDTDVDESEGEGMSEKLETQLQEALTAIEQLQQDNQQLRESNARTSEALLLRTARDYVAGQLTGYDLPDMTKSRLAESLSANPCVKDGALDTAAYDAKIEEAVKAETDYLKSVAGYGSGQITGMGSFSESNRSGQEIDEAAILKEMESSFATLGLSGSESKFAVNGR